MPEPHVRWLGTIKVPDEEPSDFPVSVGVDYELVTVGFAGHAVGLSRARAEEFARLFVAACWEAADNARLMTEETPDA
jgi:hypothetical protein